MSRYTGPKNKLSRKVGEDLGLKTNAVKVARVLQNRPGQHGAKGRRKLSGFAVQLREKQKVKYIYGVNERQLHKLYLIATKNPTATGAALLSLLEQRLDSVVYRLGWAMTRAAARQAVSHNHITVNGKKMNIPSYTVQVGDVVAIKDASGSAKVFGNRIQEPMTDAPAWLERKAGAAKVVRFPERGEIKEAIDEQLIVEYYSR